jgi:hypothetical protein
LFLHENNEQKHMVASLSQGCREPLPARIIGRILCLIKARRQAVSPIAEWIGFSLNEPGELDAGRPYFREVDQVADLPRGQFIAYNRENGEARMQIFFQPGEGAGKGGGGCRFEKSGR